MGMNLKVGDMDKVARTIHVGGVGGLGDEIKEADMAEFFNQYGTYSWRSYKFSQKVERASASSKEYRCSVPEAECARVVLEGPLTVFRQLWKLEDMETAVCGSFYHNMLPCVRAMITRFKFPIKILTTLATLTTPDAPRFDRCSERKRRDSRSLRTVNARAQRKEPIDCLKKPLRIFHVC
jgi:hypothetical protein